MLVAVYFGLCQYTVYFGLAICCVVWVAICCVLWVADMLCTLGWQDGDTIGGCQYDPTKRIVKSGVDFKHLSHITLQLHLGKVTNMSLER